MPSAAKRARKERTVQRPWIGGHSKGHLDGGVGVEPEHTGLRWGWWVGGEEVETVKFGEKESKALWANQSCPPFDIYECQNQLFRMLQSI